MEEIRVVSEQIAEEVKEVTHEDLAAAIYSEFPNNLFLQIQDSANRLINAAEAFEKNYTWNKKRWGSIGEIEKILQEEINLIYDSFFDFQNLINLSLGQRIVMTYVHVDDNGHREIRVVDNTIDHLVVEKGMWGKFEYSKIGYDINDHYQKLKNSLPDEKNKILSDTAKEVTRRYDRYKKMVLWKTNGKWHGYRFRTKGPINEAYVNFFVHNINLIGEEEYRVGRFIADKNYGAIKADSTKGFLIGDVQRDGVQYAVKGRFGGPQAIKEVIDWTKKLRDKGFSPSALREFINYFAYDELEKKYKPHITKQTKETIEKFVNEKEINKLLLKDSKLQHYIK